MDPATFVVTTLAGALLNEVATDTYKTVKAVLVGRFRPWHSGGDARGGSPATRTPAISR